MTGIREENTEPGQREIKSGAEAPTFPTDREGSAAHGKPPQKAAPPASSASLEQQASGIGEDSQGTGRKSARNGAPNSQRRNRKLSYVFNDRRISEHHFWIDGIINIK